MRSERLAEARLYFVTDLRAATESIVLAALEGGADLVQLRERRANDEAIVTAGSRLRDLCHERGALFLVNDRPDLALACEADGVHVGQEDMGVAEARAILGGGRVIGLSTHSRDQIQEAAGADYISVGPVWETPTKEGRPAVGLGLVRFAADNATLPFYAIGGIDIGNVTDVVAAGASRIAVVRAIRDSADPRAVAGALRAALPD